MAENKCGDVYGCVEADSHPCWVLGAEYKRDAVDLPYKLEPPEQRITFKNPSYPNWLANRPSTPNNYYEVGNIAVIDYIKAKLTLEQYKGYLLGNIYKYSGRCQYKGEYQKDVLKLAQYTNWLLKEEDAHPT